MKHVPAIFILAAFLSLFSSPAFAQDITTFKKRVLQTAEEKQLHLRPEWQRLMHYRKTLFSGWESEADHENFFVAPQGKTDPQAELHATIEGFFSAQKRSLQGTGVPTMSVRCQFPARFKWLNHELQLDSQLPPEECREFSDFRNKLAARSTTMVFSSYHMSGPSSAFGHTLLRINKSAQSSNQEHHQLLDYGINYAANPNTSNPILYAFYGFFGGFPGSFANMPYYYKVREYNDFESRDLWEYDLNLTQDEIDMMVAHIWELGSTQFDYFYINENCSYHMLTLLEAAAPRLNLINRIPYYVLPVETVKALFAEPGLVRDVQYRPSIHTQFNARLSLLSKKEEKALRSLNRNSDLQALKTFDPTSQAKILDAYIDYFDLLNNGSLIEKEPNVSRRKQTLLLARSQLPITPPLQIEAPLEDDPRLSHGSSRAMFSYTQSQNFGSALGVAVRFALHDVLDPSVGSPTDSEVEFGHIQLRWWESRQQLKLENFTLVGVGTYQPLRSFERRPSWRMSIGAERVLDERCENCTAGSLKGGVGATIEWLQSPRLLTSLLLEGALQASEGFNDHHFTSLLGPTLLMRLQLHRNAWLLSEWRYQRALSLPTFEKTLFSSAVRFAPTTSWALEGRAQFTNQDRELTLGLARYF